MEEETWRDLLRKLHRDPDAVIQEISKWSRAYLKKLLDWLLVNVAAVDKGTDLLGLQHHILDLIQQKPTVVSRQYITFLYGTKEASCLQLRSVLRHPAVYSLHPEPDVAAGIRVSERYRPRLDAWLLNYSSVAFGEDLDDEIMCDDDGGSCPCIQALRPNLDPSVKNFVLKSGHFHTFELKNLKWPILHDLQSFGKKFRLPCSMKVVIQELECSLENYVAWYTQMKLSSRSQLEQWAAEVLRRCKLNWEREASNLRPEGNNDAAAQIKAAHRLLVFVPDDRAQYTLHAVCRSWYKKTDAEHLQQSQVYAPASNSCEQVMTEVQQYVEFWNDHWQWQPLPFPSV